MKLWLKIFLFSFILFIFTLNIAGYILIQKVNDDIISKEIEKCISEQGLVTLQFKINSMSLKEGFENCYETNKTISTLMQEYNAAIVNNNSDHGYVEILNEENEVVYTDMNFPSQDKNEELNNMSQGITNYIIKTLNGKQYLYVSSLENVYDSQIKVRFAKNISSIYTEKNKQYNFFIKISLFVSTIFAIFMFFISRLIAKPINTLVNSTEKIISGDYSERVEIKSRDEFKVLSYYFNKMAETVEDKIGQLEESNVEKETLINNLTHELKTPLTSIIGYSNLIRTSKYDENLFFECADYIYKQGKRLESMTLKMMDLIYAKNQKISLEKQNVKTILYEIKRVLKINLEKKNINLIIEGIDFELFVDKDLIRELLCNLIDNSIKASPNNSKVILKTYKSENKKIISVKDFGCGISKEHLEKIWQPFYVVDKARSRKNNGAGIGLSICKRIAEVHKAQIEIISTVGEGTEIRIIFNKNIIDNA